MNERPDDRRRGLRLSINTTVRVEYEGAVIEGRGADISDRGMLVISDELVPVGTQVKLSCIDETGRPVEVTARVRRHHTPGGDQPQGFVIAEDEEVEEKEEKEEKEDEENA